MKVVEEGGGGRMRQEDGARCGCNPSVVELPAPPEGARAVCGLSAAGFDRPVLACVHEAVALKTAHQEGWYMRGGARWQATR